MLTELRYIWDKYRLQLLYTATVLLVMLVTVLVMGAGRKIINSTPIFGTDPIVISFAMMAVLALAIGAVIAAFGSRIPLKPLRNMIDAANSLANGDFSTRINLKLGGELQEFNDSFNKMAEEIEHSQILRTDFINNFAHEFKTPLNSIRGFAGMLKDDNLTEEERQEYLDIIITESDRLVSLSSSILNMTKVDNQSKLTAKKRFNVSEQIRLVIVLLMNRWEEKKLDVSFDADEIEIAANDQLTEHIWMNLLDNAIKFSPEGGSIVMKLEARDGNAVFSIRDQGPGMDEKTVQRMFHRFYQGDTSHAAEGFGLGLPMARKIAELHNGTINLVHTGSDGTEFEVVLPLN